MTRTYSVNFFAVPLIAWIMQACRPDVFVHVLMEQAGSTQRFHLDFIARFLLISILTPQMSHSSDNSHCRSKCTGASMAWNNMSMETREESDNQCASVSVDPCVRTREALYKKPLAPSPEPQATNHT